MRKYCMMCWNINENKIILNSETGEEECAVCGESMIDYIYSNNELLERIKLVNELSILENKIF